MEKEKWLSPLKKQIWTVSAVWIQMIGGGIVLSYPSCLLPALREPDSLIKSDIYSASWIASCVGLASIPGFFFSTFVMEYWGRRIAHCFAILPAIVGWIIIYFAINITTILVGRIFCGITVGASIIISAVVIGEYSSPEHRGMFLNIKSTAVALGAMIMHILSNFVSWKTVALIASIPYILSVIITLTWPESPIWLASKKQFVTCERAFVSLRGKDEKSLHELKEMMRAQSESNTFEVNTSCMVKIIQFLKKCSQKNFYNPLLVIFVSTVLMEISGRHFFPAYAFDIIGEITGNKTQSFYCTLGLDIVVTVGSACSSILVKLVKRRTLLFGTGLAALAVLAAFCIYLFLVSREVISPNNSWIPVSLFVVYFILVNLGCIPLPIAFVGELLPLAHRGSGSFVVGIILSICLQGGIQIPSLLLASVKVYGTFSVLGTSMAAIFLLLYFILPETKDRTLLEIDYFFRKGKYRDDNVSDDNDDEVKTKMILYEL